ncbi:hypothetical protein E1301_Tti017820 [Triplophysa tibetana]|uniref:Uncharacterized protein n=1 Tax=Triplophysa tibetana TaxID=1572043 RepID=A0A5A9N6U3_9TELE|nr:hypothetical protein E1301_Tti017820 [Triplophysa tibetana]
MTKSQARGVPSNSTKRKKLKHSVDDEQNERTEKNVKTKKKTTDNEVCENMPDENVQIIQPSDTGKRKDRKKKKSEVCEVIVPEEDLVKPQNAKRKPKKQTDAESTEKTKMTRKRKAEVSKINKK